MSRVAVAVPPSAAPPPPPSPDDELLGVVLAGGASSRMGTPKATLVIDDEPLLRRVVRAASAVSRQVVVIAEPGLVLPSGCLDGLHTTIDRIDDPADARFGGPLRALGHFSSNTAWAPLRARARSVLLLGVDHPVIDDRVTLALARRWREAVADASVDGERNDTAPPSPRPAAIVPRDSQRGPQPLLAIYDADALWTAVESRLAAGDARLRSILDVLPRVAWVDVEAIGPRELGWPANTREELVRVLAALHSGDDGVAGT